MLHSFRPMAVTCALLTTIALHAASYLTVTDSDGSKTSFELSQKPAISFTYNSLRLVAGEQTIDNFEYAVPLAKTVCLGNISALAGKGSTLKWNGRNVTNNEKANSHVTKAYRSGWNPFA